MYYVEMRFPRSARAEKFDLLQNADAAIAWGRKNAQPPMIFSVFAPPSITPMDLARFRAIGAVLIE